MPGRDPDRMAIILDVLAEAWATEPDMRLGQIIFVCAGGEDVFNIEDDRLLSGLRRYLDESAETDQKAKGAKPTW